MVISPLKLQQQRTSLRRRSLFSPKTSPIVLRPHQHVKAKLRADDLFHTSRMIDHLGKGEDQ
jgi:hypothetical protein